MSLFDGAMRLLKLKQEEKDLNQQFESLKLNTKEVNADSMNKLAKIGFNLANLRIKIHSEETKKNQQF